MTIPLISLRLTHGYPGDMYFDEYFDAEIEKNSSQIAPNPSAETVMPPRAGSEEEIMGILASLMLGETIQEEAHLITALPSSIGPNPPENTQRPNAVVTLDTTYPREIMMKLTENAEKIAQVLASTESDVNCLSGFDMLSPELSLSDDDRKDFFTGNLIKSLH